MVVGGLVLGSVVAPAVAASAHPLGNFTVNLYSGIVVEPGRLHVDYVLDMAEIPTQQEMPNIDADGDGTASPAEKAAWARRQAPGMLAGLRVSIAGRPVVLEVVSASMIFRPGQAGLPILRLQAALEGALPASGSLRFSDRNYSDRIGWREITAVGANGTAVGRSSVPSRSVSDALLRYPKALLSSPLRVTSATVAFAPGRSGTAPEVDGTAAGARPGISGGGFARLATWSGVTTPLLLLALVLAMAFGAVHALLPGHGKTIMAAYLVGAGGKVRQAAKVGVAVAFMHTASVLAVGLLVLSAESLLPPERIYPWLTLLSGVIIVGLGTALVTSRLRARRLAEADHDHGSESPGHDHGGAWHTHTHPDAALVGDRPLSRRSLIALAAAGGVLPSPTALVVLLSTVAAHRVAFGLGLIFAFSVGLAAALVLVGILALRARELVGRRLRGAGARLIPVVSASVIVVVGAFLVVRGAIQL
jgi:ABC-type nickel/cobalt efflux system permease component RcnA